MDTKKRVMLVLVSGIATMFVGLQTAHADDFKDGIAEVTDDPVTASDSLPQKTVNLSYIIADAIAQAKKGSKEAGKVEENYNDGTGENMQNSIVIEPGSHVDKVINVITQK